MTKDIKGKPYSPPLVYDIGGPNLNVVGVTYAGCNTGSGGTARCCGGGGGGVSECDTGGAVFSSNVCATGDTPAGTWGCNTGMGGITKCCTGSNKA